MDQSKFSFKNQIRDVIFLIFIGLIMTLLYGYNLSSKQFWIVGIFSSSMWILLWKGNEYLSDVISRYIDWLTAPIRSLIYLSVGSILYTIGVVMLLMKSFQFFTIINFNDSTTFIFSATIVTIVISLFMHGRSFLINWKQTALDAEKLKRESVSARYESLKSQVNPHFLFNSLNALTSLVYEDQDKAAKFIKQLSDVYRYVLDTREMEVVTIADEIKFLNSYLFLQQMRFGENLIIKNELKKVNGNLPPLALQMLIENAIKHNVISKENPLTIHLFMVNNRVVVRNNLQLKGKVQDNSGGIGLQNIIHRYEFLSDRSVEINNDNSTFEVSLPILTEGNGSDNN